MPIGEGKEVETDGVEKMSRRLRRKEKLRLLNERKRMWPARRPKAWKLIIRLGIPSKKD
jgi:hypothetical protein